MSVMQSRGLSATRGLLTWRKQSVLSELSVISWGVPLYLYSVKLCKYVTLHEFALEAY